MTEPANFVHLGSTDLVSSPLGIGAWAWGDRFYWGYGREYHEKDIHEAFTFSLQSGINFIDTAEVYGWGRSEKYIGQFLRNQFNADDHPSLIIATKFAPLPWRFTHASLVSALRRSLRRLGLSRIDLYQIHWPYTWVPVELWANALADVVHAGLARAVGVSNYNAAQTRRAHSVLARRGVPLASNQLPYSLLDRRIEVSGTLQVCQELGITVISYGPLAQGALTGKYTSHNLPKGPRARIYNSKSLARIQPLVKLLQEIGEAHQGKTPAQVAINWTMGKGTLPIPGVKTHRQAVENAGAMGWQLTPDEMDRLDRASQGMRA